MDKQTIEELQEVFKHFSNQATDGRLPKQMISPMVQAYATLRYGKMVSAILARDMLDRSGLSRDPAVIAMEAAAAAAERAAAEDPVVITGDERFGVVDLDPEDSAKEDS